MLAWVKVVKMHDVTLYLSDVILSGRRRCQQLRGPDKGGSTVITAINLVSNQES